MIKQKERALMWSDKQKSVFYKKNAYTLFKFTMKFMQRDGTCNSVYLSSYFF